MYSQIRSLVFQVIPGYCFSDFIYLGIIVFLITAFFSSKKWVPFIAVLIFAFVLKGFDLLLLRQSSSIVIEQFLHIILLPLILTVCYIRKN